jgi:hypothetical protein
VEESTPYSKLKQLANGDVEVHTGVGLTISANYQSIKLDASVSFQAKPEKVQSAMDTAWELVNGEIARNLSDAKETLANLGSGR